MRALIFVLIVAVLLVIAAVATGFLNISQVREAKAPQVTTTGNGITAKGGQSPAFQIETGSVKVGAKQTNVNVPTLVVQKPGTAQNSVVANNAM